MSRWEPNARERLERAALELYRERGFDQTTVSEIAARAGLTERTFFRYFADKREVLFSGSAHLKELLAAHVAAAPAATPPLDAVGAALEATATFFDERRTFARQRHAVVAAHPDLQERELIKLASLATVIAEALRGRGVAEPAASLASEVGIAVFKLAFERWVLDTKQRGLAVHVRDALTALKAVAAPAATKKKRAFAPRAPARKRPRPRAAG